jgi:hypothetical protein
MKHPMAASHPPRIASIDIFTDMEDFLVAFEGTCSGRGKLSGILQLACFYVLLLFSVVKSLLIDTYSTRTRYEEHSPWHEADAARISSAYKALVSVFSWASKTDVMLANDKELNDSQIQVAIRDARKMLHQDRWEERGIKGSKDFLLGLTSFIFPGAYNGFFVQKFGLAQLGESLSKTVDDCATGSEHGLRIGKSTDLSSLGFPTPWQVDSRTTLDDTSTQSIKLSDSRARGSTVKPKAKQTAAWEHTVVSEGGVSVLLESTAEGTRPVIGRRKGRLDPEVKAKAAHLRQIGACWRCWISKVPVSRIKAFHLRILFQ